MCKSLENAQVMLCFCKPVLYVVSYVGIFLCTRCTGLILSVEFVWFNNTTATGSRVRF